MRWWSGYEFVWKVKELEPLIRFGYTVDLNISVPFDRILNLIDGPTKEGRINRHSGPEEGTQQTHGKLLSTQVEEANTDENSSIQLSQSKMN